MARVNCAIKILIKLEPRKLARVRTILAREHARFVSCTLFMYRVLRKYKTLRIVYFSSIVKKCRQ
jgi:hypothetical protein